MLVLIGALFFFSLRAIEQRRQTQQARAHQKWEVMDKLPRNVGLRQAEVFHHVLETNVEEMARHDQIIRELDEASARILSDFEMLLDDEKERHLFARLVQARKVYMERTEELLVLSRANRDAEKTRVALTKQSPAYFEYHRVADELIEEVEENARRSRADTSRLIWQLGRNGGVIVGLAVLLTLGTGLMVVLRITRRLRADNVTLQTEMAERKLAEAASAQLVAIVNSSDDAIVGKDLNGIVSSWNYGAEKVFGYAAEEMIGQSITRLIPADRQGEEVHVLSRIRRGESVEHFETVRVAKDGRQIDISLTVSPIRDASGRVTGASKVARDITERKRAEREILQLNAQLENRVLKRTAELAVAKDRAEAADRLKSEFLAHMSHELRTPLNGIIGFSEFLIDGKPGPLNPKQLEYMSDVLTSGRDLLALINDVLDLAKVEAGKMELHPEVFSFRGAVTEICSIIGAMANEKEVVIERELDVQPDEVWLDKQKFKQVLYNLLSNAVKFTHNNGRVSITATMEERSRLRLQVCDTGVGIKAEDLPKMFLEFRQLDSGLTRRHQGTGLGLALTKKIVEFQDGTISVESTPGKGSTFTVILPLKGREAVA